MNSPVAPTRVLLVEDNEGDAVLTEEALREAKILIEMDRVHDGVEALQYLRREAAFTNAPRPDLILLDLNMPRMDGREVLKHLKADPDLRSIPVVVLTTSQADQDVMNSYDLQANCYVSKPVDFEQFVTIVSQLTDFWFSIVKLPPNR